MRDETEPTMASTTTTIRLPERLRARVARAAKLAGATSHAFIVQAIAEKADREELRDDFERTAEERWAGIVTSGKTIPWSQMRRYLQTRVAGKSSPRPTPRRLGR
jgi:predicted transcriptional regulator